jgi:ATP-dependent Lon protease
LTLRGRVLPVGGLREKLTAAVRAGVRTVLVPERNRSDLVELPEEVRSLLDIRPVDSLDQVLAAALLEPEAARRGARGGARAGRPAPGARA